MPDRHALFLGYRFHFLLLVVLYIFLNSFFIVLVILSVSLLVLVIIRLGIVLLFGCLGIKLLNLLKLFFQCFLIDRRLHYIIMID